MKYLCIIQARLGSTRFPNKVMQTVGGIPMVKRVWLAAKEGLKGVDSKVIVAWPERYPDLDENNVLERFIRIIKETNAKFVIRLTADCPLISSHDIARALYEFHLQPNDYYSNHQDGHDVQIACTSLLLSNNYFLHKEHVFKDFSTKPMGLSVNTKEDLERVRQLVK